MSQWAEIRHLHINEGVGKRELGRRFGLDIKTVRRALAQTEAPLRGKPRVRSRLLDPWRGQIEGWLREEPKLTARRIERLLEPLAGRLCERTVREYVARLRRELFPPAAFVHRTHAPGATMEADFGESWAMVGGRLHKAKFLLATLPSCNAYFAKSYPVERLECLLDGLTAAFGFFGGLTHRLVLDNTSLAVKRIEMGRDRRETEAFQGWRGAWPLAVDFCAPGAGWEKGSAETGVKFIRNNLFRPMPEAESWEALNMAMERELRGEMERRKLPDGRSVAQALAQERQHLRPLPAWIPPTCRTLSRVANKFGHVQVDRVHYSVPIRWAYQPVLVKLFHDRVEIVAGNEVIATHRRAFGEGDKVLEARHVLPLLERKARAVEESTAMQQWRLGPVFEQLRQELRRRTRRWDREWIGVLRLMEKHAEAAVEAAVDEALERGSPRLQTIALLLRQQGRPTPATIEPAAVESAELAAIGVAPALLEDYDRLWSDQR